MLKMFKLNLKYLMAFIVLFLIEVFIAIFIHDGIIRPFIGDVLVVILLYTLFKGIFKKTSRLLPIYLFVFATAVEFAQYFRVIDLLNLRGNVFAASIMGTSFDVRDIFCYLVATVLLLLWEVKY